MNFYDRVMSLIKRDGITRNKMLLDLGLGKNSMVDWKIRENTPDGETLTKLAKYFNVTSDYLLGIENDLKDDSIEIIGIDWDFPIDQLTDEYMEKVKDYARMVYEDAKSKGKLK